MQHQLFGGPLKSLDEMENSGGWMIFWQSRWWKETNTKPGDSQGEERKRWDYLSHPKMFWIEEKVPVCRAPFLINHTTCSKATVGDWFGVAVNEAVCAAFQSHSVIFNKHTSYKLRTREKCDDFVFVRFGSSISDVCQSSDGNSRMHHWFSHNWKYQYATTQHFYL